MVTKQQAIDAREFHFDEKCPTCGQSCHYCRKPEPTIEHNDTGMFRIFVDDSEHSDWTGYRNVAKLKLSNGVTVVAFSPYWQGVVPTDTVLELRRYDA